MGFDKDLFRDLRLGELEKITPFLAGATSILEIGSGTGEQAKELSRLGFDVTAIDVAESNYAGDRVFPILDYDGVHLPFSDRMFDVVFSSNVLEHVRDVHLLLREVARVMRPQGSAIHILPTPAWRFWTMLSTFLIRVPRATKSSAELLPELGWRKKNTIRERCRTVLRMGWRLYQPLNQHRHGEKGNIISEIWLFHPAHWRRIFRDAGFEVLRDEPVGIFYTGELLLGKRWSIRGRKAASRLMGSGCHLFVLRKSNASATGLEIRPEAVTASS